jgi:hypothetical protein
LLCLFVCMCVCVFSVSRPFVCFEKERSNPIMPDKYDQIHLVALPSFVPSIRPFNKANFLVDVVPNHWLKMEIITASGQPMIGRDFVGFSINWQIVQLAFDCGVQSIWTKKSHLILFLFFFCCCCIALIVFRIWCNFHFPFMHSPLLILLFFN